MGVSLPSIHDIYKDRSRNKALGIVRDTSYNSHPSYGRFDPMKSVCRTPVAWKKGKQRLECQIEQTNQSQEMFVFYIVLISRDSAFYVNDSCKLKVDDQTVDRLLYVDKVVLLAEQESSLLIMQNIATEWFDT